MGILMSSKAQSINELVDRLRDVSTELRHKRGKTFFPKKQGTEGQPISLEGYVRNSDVADLIHYVADMLEE